jgi:hypothetical protein
MTLNMELLLLQDRKQHPLKLADLNSWCLNIGDLAKFNLILFALLYGTKFYFCADTEQF